MSADAFERGMAHAGGETVATAVLSTPQGQATVAVAVAAVPASTDEEIEPQPKETTKTPEPSYPIADLEPDWWFPPSGRNDIS